MPVSIDSRRIRHLRVAVDEGSLTRAAKTLGISQPALSMSIRSLEADLGVTLLTRHRHGVRPTAFADILATSSRTVETELAHTATRLSQLKLATAGMVSIGCGPSESSRLLPMALVLLRRTHPEIRIIVEYGLNESLMPLVANGDIAFALSSVSRHSMHPDLKQQPLFADTPLWWRASATRLRGGATSLCATWRRIRGCSHGVRNLNAMHSTSCSRKRGWMWSNPPSRRRRVR